MGYLKLGDMPLSDVDWLIAETPIPPVAWRFAGLEKPAYITTLFDCQLTIIEAFSAMNVTTPDGQIFVNRARQARDIMYYQLGENAANNGGQLHTTFTGKAKKTGPTFTLESDDAGAEKTPAKRGHMTVMLGGRVVSQ